MAERQEGLLTAVSERLSNLSSPLPSRTEPTETAFASLPATTIPVSPPQLARLEKFFGSSGDCRSFVQLGRTKLTAEERFRENLSLYCGQPRHRLATCPLKERAHQ